MSNIWSRKSRADKWQRRAASVGGCIGFLVAVALVLGAAGAFVYGIVRLVRFAWTGT